MDIQVIIALALSWAGIAGGLLLRALAPIEINESQTPVRALSAIGFLALPVPFILSGIHAQSIIPGVLALVLAGLTFWLPTFPIAMRSAALGLIASFALTSPSWLSWALPLGFIHMVLFSLVTFRKKTLMPARLIGETAPYPALVLLVAILLAIV